MNKSSEIIDKLIELKNENSVSSYPHIKNIIKSLQIPLIAIKIQSNNILVRYRRHNELNKDIFFSTSKELSYRTDILNISNFGRANEPGQGLFYCNDIQNQGSGITEVFSVFRQNENSQEEILTIGAWELIYDLELVAILPNNFNYEDIIKMIKNNDNDQHIESYEQLLNMYKFIGEEFSIDVDYNKSNYKVSTAFSMYIKEMRPQFDGIIYPSVKSAGKGFNIVLWPKTVDNKLKFKSAVKKIFKKITQNDFLEIKVIESNDYLESKDKIIWDQIN